MVSWFKTSSIDRRDQIRSLLDLDIFTNLYSKVGKIGVDTLSFQGVESWH
jgi:hypothetical protein